MVCKNHPLAILSPPYLSMKYVRVLIILLILWTPLGACALNTVPRDSIVADFDMLVSIIVRTHPDP